MAMSHQNRLSFMLYEFLRISDSDYFGVSEYSQNLHSSETLLFADYSQRFGRFFYDINPGISFLTYRLKGMEAINHLTPRLQARIAYMIDRRQQLQFAFALGNTYPRINTINNVEQQIDPAEARRRRQSAACAALLLRRYVGGAKGRSGRASVLFLLVFSLLYCESKGRSERASLHFFGRFWGVVNRRSSDGGLGDNC